MVTMHGTSFQRVSLSTAYRRSACDLQATLLLHLVLWLWDKLPLGCILTSAAAQVAYLRMLRNFPFFRVIAPDTAAAVGALHGLTAVVS